MEPSAATGRPGPRAAQTHAQAQTQTQAQAQVQAQVQADAPFGGMLATGLIAGAVTGVIEERMAEAASRQALPVVSTALPARDATSVGNHGLGTDRPLSHDSDHDSATPSGGAVLSPSNEPDSTGAGAASLAIQPNASAAAAELTATSNHLVSPAPAVPVAEHAVPAPSGHAEGSASFDLTARIAHEITGTVGQIVVKLGQFADGGVTGGDQFGESLAHEIAGAATRIASDLTGTFSLSPTDTAPLAKVASLPTQVLAEVSGTVDHLIGTIGIPVSLLGAEEDHVTPPLLSRVFDHAEPALTSVPAPDITHAGDAGAVAIGHLAGDIGSISIGFAGQSYVDTHGLHDGAFGPATNLLHGFV
jgi:hypothetical protein